jgi:hypothetical protein
MTELFFFWCGVLSAMVGMAWYLYERKQTPLAPVTSAAFAAISSEPYLNTFMELQIDNERLRDFSKRLVIENAQLRLRVDGVYRTEENSFESQGSDRLLQLSGGQIVGKGQNDN